MIETIRLISLLVVLFLGLIAIGSLAIKIVKQSERGVLLRFGRLVGTRKPGFNLIIPIVDRMIKVDLRIVTMVVEPQAVISKDDVTIKVDAVVYFMVVDPEKAVIKVADYMKAISQIALTTLRSVLGQSDLDELLFEREQINTKLREIILDRASCIGCHHKSTELECSTCHRIQGQFLKGVALVGDVGESDPMAGEVPCNSCHENITQGHSPQEVRRSCLNCHGPGYDGILEEWHSEISERLKRARRHLLVLRARFRHSETDVPEQIASKVDKAETMINLVEKDKSMGGRISSIQES